MLFRQLYDPETSTYSYLLADETTREALLIDTVRERFDRDTSLIRELGLKLILTLETHVHADHVTASGRFRDELSSKVAVSVAAGVANADIELKHEDTIEFGSCSLEARLTPGHTSGCVTYVSHSEGFACTGDALLIRGCGRTDFQEGDPKILYRSVRQQILSLPDETVLYPAHDYQGRMLTTVAEEKSFNARLGLDKSEQEFEEIMNGLNLAYPKRIDEVVPANLSSGLLAKDADPGAVAQVMDDLGRQNAEVFMGAGI
jgi:sulfur dioxygenase